MKLIHPISAITICTLLLGSFIFTACSTSYSGLPSNQINLDDVSYEGVIKNIISENCTTCHAGKRPSAGLNLKSYDNLVDAIKNKNLLKRINDPSNPMPTSGLLPKKQRLAIQKWAENEYAMTSKTPATNNNSNMNEYAKNFVAPDLKAVDINKKGFDFFEKIQGHWVGNMFLLGDKLPWFAFDFRAINTSQVHGIFEGGSMGNLFNTFFVAEYKGVKTIMLRNGGILGGIYRTSYFVLTKAENNEYLFEDAYGGKQIMWMKVSFNKDKINILTHTSRLGLKRPSKHMEFEGRKLHTDFAQRAASRFSYPTKKVVKKFPNGMPLPIWGDKYPVVSSASYITDDDNLDYVTLGKRAQDPIQITDIQNIAAIDLHFKRNDLSKNKNVSVYLSRQPLTDSTGKLPIEYGYIKKSTMNQVILFPEIDKRDEIFRMNYLHTGKCYITFVVDNDNNLAPSKGDFYSESVALNLTAQRITQVDVEGIVKTIK